MQARDFLLYIVSNLISNKDALTIEEKEDELGMLFTISIDKEDMGTIIGKSGNTINSIRAIMRLYGSKIDKRINIKVLD